MENKAIPNKDLTAECNNANTDSINVVTTDLKGTPSHGNRDVTTEDMPSSETNSNTACSADKSSSHNCEKNSKIVTSDHNCSSNVTDTSKMSSLKSGTASIRKESPSPIDEEVLTEKKEPKHEIEKSVFHPSLKSHQQLFADHKACIYCGKMFDKDLDLENHVRGHVEQCNGDKDQKANTDIAETPMKDSDGEGEAEKMDTVNDLNEHSKICSDTEKDKKSNQIKSPLTCQYCEKTFMKVSLLNKHIAIHTRPYSCQACGKSFGRRSHLNRHVRGHADHICSICNLMCDSAKSLKSHQDSHFQEEDSMMEQDVQPSLEDYDITVKLRAEEETLTPYDNIQAEPHNVGDAKKVKEETAFSDSNQPTPDAKQIDPRKAVKFANLDRKIKMLHKFKTEQSKAIPDMTDTNDSPALGEINEITVNDTEMDSVGEEASQVINPEMFSSGSGNSQNVLQAVGLQYNKEMFQGVGQVIKCEHCGKVFLEKHEYRIHLRCHTGERPFRCGTCGKAYKQSSHLYCHMKIHYGDKDYICSICNKSFSKCMALKNHMFFHGAYIESGIVAANETQATREIDSEIEGKLSASIQLSDQEDTFTANDGENETAEPLVDIAVQSEQDDIEKYGGSTDDEDELSEMKVPDMDHSITESPTSVQSRSLSLVEVKFEKKTRKKSKKLKHSNIPAGKLLANQCEVCGKVMSSKSSLRKHVYLHSGKKPYKCGVCNKSYPHSWYLTSHMKFHTDSWAHFCKLCDMHFMYKSTLKRHLCRKHKLDGDECSELLSVSEVRPKNKNIRGDKSEKEENKQPICNTLQENLTNTEIGSKKYVCRFCKLLFPNHLLLQFHLRTHAKPRRFRCMRCSLTCKDYGKLRRHSFLWHKRHESGWKCYFCRENFSQFWRWKQHMKWQHPERMPGGEYIYK